MFLKRSRNLEEGITYGNIKIEEVREKWVEGKGRGQGETEA